MKYLLLLTMIFGCTEDVSHKVPPRVLKIDSSELRMIAAKKLADSIYYYVEQVDMKKMTKKNLDKIATPMQREMDSLKKLMMPYDIEQVDKYRTRLVEKMVDRKVLRDNE